MSDNNFDCSNTIIHDEIVNFVQGKMLSEEILDNGAEFFKVMGNSTRFRILWALDKHEMCVCDLAALLGMTKSAISHQLAVLRKANLVQFRRDGKVVYYSIADDHVHIMLDG
ncbi:MAG TPA: winged helix-turn-helix transcriptional regulator, partial [Clostridiaceae bacterium]|nr:winged helix-turn-helix transcriptional regulator [Clostridiaceae bacterium]